jgi:putative intracellular protease/amidase
MANDNSLAGLMKWLRREQWQEAFNEVLDRHLAPACATADVSIDELPDLIGDHHTAVLWGCVFEDFLTRDLDDGRNIVDDYLKRRGWKESASSKAYITALRSSVMSLYEISDIVREESFLARDLVRGGDPVRVSERSGTRYLKPWDRIAARLVRTRSGAEMAGGALPFDRDASETALKALRRVGKKARADVDRFARKLGRGIDSALLADALTDTELLRASAFLFTNIWLDDLLQRTLHPTLPQMCNTDGDELVFTTVSYQLKPEASADAVRMSLAAIPALRPESETFWNWIAPNKPTGKKQRTDRQTLITTLGDGSLVLGTVELKGKRLVLEANSPQRAERGRGMIEPVLGDFVDEPLVATRTVAQLMASRSPGKSEPLSSGLSPDEERAVLQENMDRYCVNLLDEPVPMLGNMTPRRAAKSTKSREKLVTWLKSLENGAARYGSGSPMAGCDWSWMWTELGVAHLRR